MGFLVVDSNFWGGFREVGLVVSYLGDGFIR
jgi:hypothetical protein